MASFHNEDKPFYPISQHTKIFIPARSQILVALKQTTLLLFVSRALYFTEIILFESKNLLPNLFQLNFIQKLFFQVV